MHNGYMYWCIIVEWIHWLRKNEVKISEKVWFKQVKVNITAAFLSKWRRPEGAVPNNADMTTARELGLG